MNKHDVLLNIIKNKIFFISKRCKHDYNVIFNLNNLLFVFNSTCTFISKTILLSYLLSILKRSLISIIEDETI